MSQLSAQVFQRPVTLQIDLNQATYQAFLNCINSFQGLETESEMRSAQGAAISTMSSKVSLERFIYNLGILSGLRDGDGYNVEMGSADAFRFWAKTVKEMKDGDFFKQPRREAHL
jgi:hypothetical protein